MIKIGIIGGTGFGNPELLENAATQKVHTPYGAPSGLVTTGRLEGIEIAAIALANKFVLVTGNTRHFERIPDLTVENWLI